MDNYKKAARIGLRVLTSKGSLSVEQLYSLSQTDLSNAIRNVKKQLKASDDSDDLGFLEQTTPKDSTLQLTFDILKDVYLTKKEELDAKATEKANKEHNQKIMEIIQRKKGEKLEQMSEEELLALMK